MTIQGDFRNPSRRILWFLPKWPLPAQDGARVANVSLLKGLTSLGAQVDVVAIAGSDEHCDIESLRRICGVSDCTIIRRHSIGGWSRPSGVLRALFALLLRPGLPITLLPYARKKVARSVARLLARGYLRDESASSWDLIVYDGLHPAAHAQKFGEYSKNSGTAKVIYRAHNVESEIWDRRRRLTRFFPLRLFLAYQTFLMKRFEKSVLKNVDAVMTVSDVDLDIFRRWLPEVRGGSVPIAYDFERQPSVVEQNFRLLFLGKLDWPPNRDGLRWFLEKVWPEASRRRPEARLCIAGSGDAQWLRKQVLPPNIEFLGRVEDLDELYRKSLIALVPVFYGSGTRVKAIEASRYGRACLGTALGVEGVGLEPGETYIRAETAEEWIQAIVNLRIEEVSAMGQKAYVSLKNSYHLPAAAQKFLDIARS